MSIAQVPDEVERADVALLHGSSAATPDYQRLLGAAASKTGRLLVFSHPPGDLVSRAVFSAENGMRRLKGETFRAFVHPPAAMRNVAVESGCVTPTDGVSSAGTWSDWNADANRVASWVRRAWRTP